MRTINVMCVGACTETCEHVRYTSILIHTHSLCMCACVHAGDSVSARVFCFSVCQFHFVMFD